MASLLLFLKGKKEELKQRRLLVLSVSFLLKEMILRLAQELGVTSVGCYCSLGLNQGIWDSCSVCPSAAQSWRDMVQMLSALRQLLDSIFQPQFLMKTSSFMAQLCTILGILFLFGYQKAVFSPENLNSDWTSRGSSSYPRIWDKFTSSSSSVKTSIGHTGNITYQ